MKKRGFEVVSRYQQEDIRLPQRQTRAAAGYDLEAAEDFVVPTIWRQPLAQVLGSYLHSALKRENFFEQAQKVLQPVLVPTGLKVYMPSQEVLLLVSRSSGPLKRGLVMPNAVGVIDADYYNNPHNEGEIFVQMLNFFPRDRVIHKGERICQGIFVNYLVTDQELKEAQAPERQGGFGSSGLF